jgi:hypothetical protein
LIAMAKRGRQPGFRMSDEHRVKIQNSNILNALIEHAVGKRKMSATQVNAGLGLLKKVLPDLSAMALTGGDGVSNHAAPPRQESRRGRRGEKSRQGPGQGREAREEIRGIYVFDR